jgi:uncharacterized membrane protein (DUF2068 family)
MFSVIRVLGHDLWESARDLMPVVLVVAFFQVVVLRQALPDVGRIIGGAVAVVVGELMARGFARRGRLPALVVFAFALGFTTTVAEPALIAIAGEAADVAAADGAIDATVRAREAYALGLRATVAVSVGVALVVGVLRIIKGWPIRWLIIGGYLGVVALTAFAPPDIVGIAYDSGGVTTSTVTVPLVTALGVGLSSSIRGRSPLVDGFGLIALASLTPIMFVLGYGMLA